MLANDSGERERDRDRTPERLSRETTRVSTPRSGSASVRQRDRATPGGRGLCHDSWAGAGDPEEPDEGDRDRQGRGRGGHQHRRLATWRFEHCGPEDFMSPSPVKKEVQLIITVGIGGGLTQQCPMRCWLRKAPRKGRCPTLRKAA